MEKMKKQTKIEMSERDSSPIALLPEPMIQHIQSFLTGKEAARSMVLDKSWCQAWLTRPMVNFDERDFENVDVKFDDFSRKTMERYRAMNLRIESFTLRMNSEEKGVLAMELTADAIQLGATDLNIYAIPYYNGNFILPAAVLGSEGLTRLCLRGGRFGEGNVRCSRLKSLTVEEVHLERDDQKSIIRDILSCCSPCIEELSLCASFYRFRSNELLQARVHLHKLMRLNLKRATIEESFFSKLATDQFPCLKDLTIDYCEGYSTSTIQIASTSLERISFVDQYHALKADFDIPNIQKFVYLGRGLPSLSFKRCSKEWESDISITWMRHYKSTWFLRLKNLLTKMRASSSRISLFVFAYVPEDPSNTCNSFVDSEKMKEIEGVHSRHVVELENLTIRESSFSTTYPSSLLLLAGLFRVCRPTYILDANDALMEKMTTINLNLSAQIQLSMEFYDEILQEWRPYITAEPSTAASSSRPNFRLHCTPV